MIPILYEEDELDFTSNGIGRLSDCLKCTSTEARNGIFEVAFVYPVTGQYYSEIRERRIIYCTYDDTQEPQPFDIYGHSAPLNGKVTFYAQHVSYRLGKQTVLPFSAGSATQAMSRLGSNIVGGTTFTFWTDKSTAADYYQTVPKSVRACLGGSEGSILDVYGGGEYKFDKWAVRLYQNRGTDTGVQIRYGKNLTRLTHDVDGSETYSAVVPFWKPFEEGQETVWYPGIVYSDTVQTRLTVWTDENGEDVEDENGDAIDIRYSIAQVIPLDLSEEFDEQPTENQLRLKAQSYLSGRRTALPTETLDIDFVALWQTTEYADVASLQRVKLCDYVSVYYPEMGVAVENVEVIKTVYNVLLDRYDRMELGQPKQSFAGLVKGQTAAMLEAVPTKSSMAQAIDHASKLIQGGLGGHVVMSMDEASGKPNEILIMDTEDINTAVNVLRINMNGIGFSKNGYNGPFETAWTLDGHFNASWIDTGVLSAELLKVGVIQPKTENGNYWNLDNDEFVLRNAKINITTTDEYYDVIELNAGDWVNEITPLMYRLKNTNRHRMLTIQAGGIWGYTTDDYDNRSNYQDLLLMAYGTVYLGGGSYDGELNINDTGKETRWKIDTDYIRGYNSSGDVQLYIQNNGSMWWYDVNGDQIATLQNGFLRLGGGSQNGALYINDTSGVRRWSITNNAIFGYNSNNINQLIAQNDGSMWWYDSSGNQIATMLNGDLSLNGLTGSVVTNINQLKKSDTWTSTAWAGLTCKAYREGKTVMITLRGTTTGNLGTESATVPVCTLPTGFTPVVTHTQYVVYGAEWKGQLVLNADGTVNIGYTRRLTATANELLPSGTNIYITATFVTGDD